MKKYGFSAAPFVTAFLLGPILEWAFRQAMIISQGNFSIFTTRPLALFFLMLTIIYIAGMFIKEVKKSKSSKNNKMI